ncbi:radical SAM protein [bacterium]|nr:radical SAM protein [bacterium]
MRNKSKEYQEKIPQFALRKEYFGGLLLDYKNKTFDILNLQEFNFLKQLRSGEELFLQDLQSSKLKSFIKKIEQKNIIKVVHNTVLLIHQIRKIPQPKEIAKNYLSAPLKVYDTYTRKCNLACKHCYASAHPNFTEKRRTISQTETIIRKFYEVGIMEWNFTGGEPTVKSDLLDAIKIAKKFKMKVSLNTNGCWNSEISKKILNSDIDEFIISLDGSEKIHDKRRGLGTFKKVVKTLDQIHKYNQDNPDRKPKVILNVVIDKNNIQDMEFMVYLAAKYGHDVKFVPIRPDGRASKSSMLSTKEYMEFARKIECLKENPKIKDFHINILLNHQNLFLSNYTDKSNLPYPFNFSQCTALTTAMDILPDGRVVTCSFLMDDSEFIGPNILDVSVYEAWKHSKMECFRRSRKEECLTCEFYMKQCRGSCRSNIILNGGRIEGNKLIGKDPYCFKDLLS